MRANRAYQLLTSYRPLARDDGRLDTVEVVCIDDGEVVLFWELAPRRAARLLRALRTDLAGLSAEQFMTRWQGADAAPS